MPNPPNLPTVDDELLREFWEERAAIREYDGKMEREAAEVAADDDTERYCCELIAAQLKGASNGTTER